MWLSKKNKNSDMCFSPWKVAETDTQYTTMTWYKNRGKQINKKYA